MHRRQSEHVTVQTAALAAIFNLAALAANRKRVGQECLALVLDVLRENKTIPSIVTYGCDALAALVFDEDVRSKALDEGALALVLDFIDGATHEIRPAVQASALEALRNFTVDPVVSSQMAGDEDRMISLTNRMKGMFENVGVQSACVGILHNLSIDAGASELVMPHLDLVMANMRVHGGDLALANSALRLFVALARTPQTQSALVHAGVLPLTLDAIKKHRNNIDIADAAMATLNFLSCNQHAKKVLMGTAEATEAVVNSLKFALQHKHDAITTAKARVAKQMRLKREREQAAAVKASAEAAAEREAAASAMEPISEVGEDGGDGNGGGSGDSSGVAGRRRSRAQSVARSGRGGTSDSAGSSKEDDGAHAAEDKPAARDAASADGKRRDSGRSGGGGDGEASDDGDLSDAASVSSFTTATTRTREATRQVEANTEARIVGVSLGTLANLSYTLDEETARVKKDGLDLLRECFTEFGSSGFAVAGALNLIRNLAVNSRNHEELIAAGFHNDAVSSLSRFPDNDRVVMFAIGVLRNLSWKKKSHEALRNCGAVHAIMRVARTRRADADVLEAAVGFVWDMGSSVANHSQMMAANAVDLVKDTMQAFPENEAVVHHCCGALRALAFSRDGVQHIFDGGCLELLFAAMRKHKKHVGVQECANGCIWNLAGDTGIKEAIVRKGGLHVIFGGLKNNPGASGVVQSGLKAIGRIQPAKQASKRSLRSRSSRALTLTPKKAAPAGSDGTEDEAKTGDGGKDDSDGKGGVDKGGAGAGAGGDDDAEGKEKEAAEATNGADGAAAAAAATPDAASDPPPNTANMELVFASMQAHAHRPIILMNANAALWNLATVDINRPKLKEALPHVMRTLENHAKHQGVAASAFGFLKNVAAHPDNKLAVVEAKALDHLRSAVKEHHKHHPAVLEHGLGLLRSLTADPTYAVACMEAKWHLEVLDVADSAGDAYPGVVAEAAAVICNLSVPPDNRLELGRKSCRRLLGLLKVHAKHVEGEDGGAGASKDGEDDDDDAARGSGANGDADDNYASPDSRASGAAGEGKGDEAASGAAAAASSGGDAASAPASQAKRPKSLFELNDTEPLEDKRARACLAMLEALTNLVSGCGW